MEDGHKNNNENNAENPLEKKVTIITNKEREKSKSSEGTEEEACFTCNDGDSYGLTTPKGKCILFFISIKLNSN